MLEIKACVSYRRGAAQHQFTEATQLLTSLRALNERFPDEHLVDLEELERTLQAARAQQAAQQEAEERRQREAEARQRAEETAQRAEEETRKERSARERLSQRMDTLERELREEKSKNDIWPAVITAAGHIGAAAMKRGED